MDRDDYLEELYTTDREKYLVERYKDLRKMRSQEGIPDEITQFQVLLANYTREIYNSDRNVFEMEPEDMPSELRHAIKFLNDFAFNMVLESLYARITIEKMHDMYTEK